MSIKRMIYKSLFSNLALSELTFEERFLYIGSIVFADDDGRMCADTRLLKAFIFPHDEDITKDSIKKMCDKIAGKNLFVVYESGGLEYLYHKDWNEYQTIRKDIYKPSVLPAPPEEISGGTEAAQECNGSGTEAARKRHGSVTKAVCSIVKSSIVKNNTTKEPVKPVNEVIPKKPVKVTKSGYSVRCSAIERIVVDYKLEQGFAWNDRAWDTAQYARSKKSAKQLLDICAGDWELATQCIAYSRNKWEQKGMSWSLSGSVINDSPEFLKLQNQNKLLQEAKIKFENEEKQKKLLENEISNKIANCQICGGTGYLFYNKNNNKYEKKIYNENESIASQLFNVKSKRCECNNEN